MKKQPEDRYASFAEIKEAMNKYDFINLDISQSDKKTYQSFTNLLMQSLSSFTDERKFNYDSNLFISKLEKVLRDNCFEDIIQKNADLISSVVIGAYRYNNGIDISCSVVKKFLDWFKASTKQSQQLILTNIISKLSLISIEESESELPF